HPLLQTGEHFCYRTSSLIVEHAAELDASRTCKNALHRIFPAMHPVGAGNIEVGHAACHYGGPAKRVAEVGRIAEYRSRDDLHIVDIDVELVNMVEEHRPYCPQRLELGYKSRLVADVHRHLEHPVDGDVFLLLTNDVDV